MLWCWVMVWLCVDRLFFFQFIIYAGLMSVLQSRFMYLAGYVICCWVQGVIFFVSFNSLRVWPLLRLLAITYTLGTFGYTSEWQFGTTVLNVRHTVTECTSYNQTQHQYYFHTNLKNVFDHSSSKNILHFIKDVSLYDKLWIIIYNS